MKIYYKSDFEIIEQFFDVNNEPIDITNIDIQLVYTTSNWEKYEVSKLTDSGLTNCYFEEIDPTKLHIVFQNHNLKPGLLIREITLFVNNINFESGTQKVMLKPETDIELVSKGGEQGIVTGRINLAALFISKYYPRFCEVIDNAFTWNCKDTKSYTVVNINSDTSCIIDITEEDLYRETYLLVKNTNTVLFEQISFELISTATKFVLSGKSDIMVAPGESVEVSIIAIADSVENESFTVKITHS